MSPPLERVGGRGPSERTLLRVVVVVLAAALLAVVKPWGGGSDTGAGAAPRSALVASPAISGSATPIPTPIPTPVDPASAFCLLPSDWRLTSLEIFGGQTIRVWQTIGPVQASGPSDPSLPEGLVVSTSVLAVGWCAPTAPDTRPDGPVTVRIWHVPPSGAPVELDLRPRLGPSDLGADYAAPDVGAGTADWTPGRYVFAIAEPAPGRSWWFAVTVRRFVPDGVPGAPADASASPVP
jgi:hypothetical protein